MLFRYAFKLLSCLIARFLHSSNLTMDMPNNADTGESTVRLGTDNISRLLIKTLSKRGEILMSLIGVYLLKKVGLGWRQYDH